MTCIIRKKQIWKLIISNALVSIFKQGGRVNYQNGTTNYGNKSINVYDKDIYNGKKGKLNQVQIASQITKLKIEFLVKRKRKYK